MCGGIKNVRRLMATVQVKRSLARRKRVGGYEANDASVNWIHVRIANLTATSPDDADASVW